MVVYKLLLPFFLIHLGITISPSVVLLGSTVIKKYIPLLLATGFLLTTSVSLFTFTTSPLPPAPYSAEASVRAQQTYLLEIYAAQPTHRDVLINLSRIEEFLGNAAQAQVYKDQAFILDPTHPLFQTQE